MPDFQNNGNQTVFVPPSNECGYILITAVWMLLLGASVVAVIMVHNLRQAEEISFERTQTQIKYAQESAVETVMADMMFNGPRSEFARLPAQTTYNIHGVKMEVSVTSESGKIDVNQADLKLIDSALRGFGIAASGRQAFSQILERERNASRLLESPVDIALALESAGIVFGNGFCAKDHFTTYSGLTRPSPDQMHPELARALGQVSLPQETRTRPGAAIRIAVNSNMTAPIKIVTRTSSLIGKAFSVLGWNRGKGC